MVEVTGAVSCFFALRVNSKSLCRSNAVERCFPPVTKQPTGAYFGSFNKCPISTQWEIVWAGCCSWRFVLLFFIIIIFKIIIKKNQVRVMWQQAPPDNVAQKSVPIFPHTRKHARLLAATWLEFAFVNIPARIATRVLSSHQTSNHERQATHARLNWNSKLLGGKDRRSSDSLRRTYRKTRRFWTFAAEGCVWN